MKLTPAVILFGIFYMTSLTNAAYTAYDAMVLQSTLATNYSTKVRPSDSTYVDITFGMMHITELNIVNQQLHVVGFLLALWTDQRLQWSESDHGGLDNIYILLSDIWAPPLVLNNAADEIQILNDDSDLSSVVTHLSSDGEVTWLAPANFRAQCTINIKYYPFDSQVCFFVVSSWLYQSIDLGIGGSISTVNMDLYEENGEWDITGSSVENISRILLSHPLPAVKFTLMLTRKYSYYLMNMVLPVIILATMAPFVFILPVESGEKMGYCLTILLSLSVVMTLVSESIPPTSTHICVLSVYLLLTFIICSVETILTVFTCRIHDFHQKRYRMGSKLQTLTTVLAKVTRSHHIYEKSNTVKSSKINLKIEKSDLKLQESINATEKVKSKAWEKATKDESIEFEEDENGFEEFALVFDKFNFFLFSIMTVIVTIVFMVILQVGGANS